MNTIRSENWDWGLNWRRSPLGDDNACFASQRILGNWGPSDQRPPFFGAIRFERWYMRRRKNIRKQHPEATKSDLRYVYRLIFTFNSTHCGCNAKNIFRKVYFNARFDDVMLMVKREMACVLRGPLPTSLMGYIMFFSLMLSYFTRYARPGKLNIGHMCVSFMLNDLPISSAEGSYKCVFANLS